MLHCAPVVAGTVEVGIVGKAILDCTADYCFRIDEAVGFGHYEAVGVAGSVAVGGAMVFNGACNFFYMAGAEARCYECCL